MTVVFETPPGNVPGDLVARFTLDREPTNISVRYFPVDSNGDPLPGSWDVVYGETDSSNENGEFSDKFSDSERSGNLWTIRPPGNGIWPCRFKIVVDEVTIAATGGLDWGTIYSLDLTAQPNQTIASAGSYTIDGLTWWAKGALPTNGESDLENGFGLQLRCPTGGGNWSWAQSGAITARSFFFPFAQVPGFNPSAPWFLQVRYTGPVGPYFSGRTPRVGVISSDNDTLLDSDERSAQLLQLYTSSGAGTSQFLWGVSGTASQSPGDSDPWGSGQIGLARITPTRFVWFQHIITPFAGFVSQDAMNTLVGTAPIMVPGGAPLSKPGLWWSLLATSNSDEINVHLTHLRILQPKV